MNLLILALSIAAVGVLLGWSLIASESDTMRLRAIRRALRLISIVAALTLAWIAIGCGIVAQMSDGLRGAVANPTISGGSIPTSNGELYAVLLFVVPVLGSVTALLIVVAIAFGQLFRSKPQAAVVIALAALAAAAVVLIVAFDRYLIAANVFI